MCFKKLDKLCKKFNIIDIGCIELGAFVFALMLAQLIPKINQINWKIYLVIFILLEIKPIITMFKKNNEQGQQAAEIFEKSINKAQSDKQSDNPEKPDSASEVEKSLK